MAHLHTLRTLLLMLLLLPLGMRGQEAVHDTVPAGLDSLQAAVLTCSPGQEVYEYYGHTALLIRNLTRGEDYVFNYGVFSFAEPNFLWRFVLGHTDYTVEAMELRHFLPEYEKRGSWVTEDRLNLTQMEVQRLFFSVLQEWKLPNWTYRYDFFYDNCATRVRDKVEAAVEGRVVYPAEGEETQSLRDIVHHYSRPYKWSVFGQDLLLGAAADKPADRVTREFAPELLEQDLLKARIVRNGGDTVPLVVGQICLVEANGAQKSPEKVASFPLSPRTCALLLLAITLLVCAMEARGRSWWWPFDATLLLLQGLTGLVITFMFFFSVHPTVGTNSLVLLFNPLPLVALYAVVRAERKGRCPRYHKVVVVWMVLFFVFSRFTIQQYSPEIYLVALSLLLRSTWATQRHRFGRANPTDR